jgi:hypothetical protein
MRSGLVLALVLALAGCGGDDPERGAAGPAEPPPVAGDNAPPPAWVETEAGTHWLGYSSFCWKNLCADSAAPACGSGTVPSIPVRPGERVGYHLGFEPQGDVTMNAFEGASPRSRTIGSGRAGGWTVEEGGAFGIFASAQSGGDASYVGCFVLSR